MDIDEATTVPTPDQPVATPALEDDFDAAFAEASGDSPAEAVPAPAEPAAAQAEPADEQAPAESPVAEQAPAESPAAEQAPATQQPATQQPATQQPATQQPATQQPAPLTADAIAEAIAKANAKAAEPAKQEPAPEKPFTAEDFLDDGAKAAVKKFEKEWPDEFAAVRKMLESETQARIANELRAFATQMNGVLAPLIQSVESVGVNTFWSEVTAAHPDAKQLTSELQAWIAEQPPLYRPALEKAATSGNPGEAVELLNLFKQAKGPTGAAPATPAPSAAQVQTPPAPAKAAPAKVAALTGVPAAQRTKPTAGADVNDYDTAFEEALGVVNS